MATFAEKLGAGAVAVVLATTACTPLRPVSLGTAASTATGVAPWELPAAALAHQYLFRLRFDGPEGEGTLRLALRLASPSRYQLIVSDRLGRPLYGIDAADGGGRLIDHRAERVCPLGASFELAGVSLGPVPLEALPRLLLGRVPGRPAAATGLPPSTGAFAFADPLGRRWSVVLEGGRPTGWSLTELEDAVLWWRLEERRNLLSDRVRGVQLSWEETLREPLAAGGPAPLVAPAAYATSPCLSSLAAGW